MSSCLGIGLHEHRNRTPDPFPEVLRQIVYSLPGGVFLKLQVVCSQGRSYYYLYPQPQCGRKLFSIYCYINAKRKVN